MADQNSDTDAQAIIAAVERLVTPTNATVEIDDVELPVGIIPTGQRLEDLRRLVDPYLLRPRRAKGFAELTDLDSFVAYANRHKSEHSLVYLDDRKVDAMRLAVVFNPHEATEAGGAPGFGDFGGRYAFPVSDELKAWREVVGKELSQADFAAFLEARILDVVEPAVLDPNGKTRAAFEGLGVSLAGSARLFELSRGLSVSVDQTVAEAVNTGSGEAQLRFKEEHRDETGAPIKVPGGFAIAIPIFRRGVRYTLGVRLRYRVRSGRVAWQLEPIEVDRAVEHAVAEAAAKVAEATGLAVLRGTPAA